MRGPFALIVAVLSLGVCAAVRAQDVAPAASAEIVRLDVVVTDAQGKPVAGLVREDFDVREDGKPQRLTDFVFVGGTRAAEPPVTPTSPAAPAPAPEAAPRPGRQIAIVVDEPHLSRRGVGAAKEILRRFVSETVAPDDAIALVVIGAPAATLQLTRDRAALRQAIERIRARADESLEGPGRQMTAAQAELILRGDPAALKLAARLLKQEPGYGADPPANAGPEFQGKGGVAPRDRIKTSDPTPAGIEPEERSAALEVQEQARGILAQALSVSGVSLAALEDVLRGMAPLPGRKLCLLVSDGFLLGRGTREEQTRQLQQVTDAATRSFLAVYALLASGVVPIAPDASMPGSAGPAGLRESVGRASEQVMLEGLRDLADETGGLVLRGSDGIADGLARMLRDTDSLYLLAYEPANRKRDGRFRKVDVRLRNRGDLIVRTRRGYFAPGGSRHVQPGQRAALPAGPRVLNLAGPVPLSPAEAQHALATPTPRTGVPVRVAADYVELVPGRPQAVVRAHVDPAGLPWKEVDGRKRAEFDLVGGVYDAGGQPVVSPFVGQHYALDVTPAEYDKLKETGVRLDAKVFLRPGRYEVRLLALDPARAALGGAAGTIQVPDLAQKKLTLSSVFLSSSAASQGSAPGSGAGEGLRDVQVLRRFKASDSLYFQLYVYNATRDAAGASDVVLQSQILSKHRPPFASKPRPALLLEKDGAPLPEADGIPLLGLVPGSYELRIVVADQKANAVASRSVDFTVEE